MAKLFTYTILCIGLTLLFSLAGITTLGNTVISKLGISSLENLPNVVGSILFLAITAVLSVIIGTGINISVGTFGKTTNESSIYATIALSTFSWFMAEWGSLIYNLAKESEPTIAIIISVLLIPLAFGYAYSILDWIRGTD
jgi:hypothetical protein